MNDEKVDEDEDGGKSHDESDVHDDVGGIKVSVNPDEINGVSEGGHENEGAAFGEIGASAGEIGKQHEKYADIAKGKGRPGEKLDFLALDDGIQEDDHGRVKKQNHAPQVGVNVSEPGEVEIRREIIAQKRKGANEKPAFAANS